MEATTIFFRTLLIYFVIYLVLRVMGKREIGKLSVFDLVISIMITELAVIVVEDPQKPVWHGVLPIVVLAGTQIGIAYLTLKSQTLRRWFDGKPSIIIEQGSLNREEMKKQRYSLDDLLIQLRENKVKNVADVEFAILEATGKLTVTTKEQKQTKPQDKGKTFNENESPNARGSNCSGSKPKSGPIFRYEGLPLPLIMDGKVQDDNLDAIGKTRFWLKNELQAHGVQEVKDVFLCTVDHNGKLFVNKK